MLHESRNNKAWFLVGPAVLLVVLNALIPLLVVVNYSVQDVFFGNQFLWIGADWFEQVIRSQDFQNTLVRSLCFSILILFIEVPLGIFIALMMPKNGVRASLYIVLISIPLLIPWFVVGVIWKVMVNKNVGLLGWTLASLGYSLDLNNPVIAWTTIVLMDIWHWTSLIVLLCYAGLVSIPDAYYQSARIDAASKWSIFRFVQLPKIKRVLLIGILLRFMDSFMIYIEPFMMTRGGPGVSTTFLSLDLVQVATVQFDLGEAGAMSVIYFLIILMFSWGLYTVLMRKEV